MIQTLKESVKEKPQLATLVLGGVIAMTLVFTVFGVVDVANAFQVCEGNNMSQQMQEDLSNFMSFLLAAAFGGGTLYAAIGHAKVAMGIGDGDKIWESDAIKAAVGLPLGLYFIDFGLATVFDVSITCIMPW